MKRKSIFGLAVCFFLLLGTIAAQEMNSRNDRTDKSGKWVALGAGVSYQRLSSDGEWPEVAVLRLSNDAYEKFRESPAKFINNYKGRVFSKTVNDPSPAGVTLEAPQEPNGYWFVILSHGHPSISYFGAIPEPVEGSKQSQKP
jgi:hypothetical protein